MNKFKKLCQWIVKNEDLLDEIFEWVIWSILVIILIVCAALLIVDKFIHDIY
jgi:hypothetical protein